MENIIDGYFKSHPSTFDTRCKINRQIGITRFNGCGIYYTTLVINILISFINGYEVDALHKNGNLIDIQNFAGNHYTLHLIIFG